VCISNSAKPSGGGGGGAMMPGGGGGLAGGLFAGGMPKLRPAGSRGSSSPGILLYNYHCLVGHFTDHFQ